MEARASGEKIAGAAILGLFIVGGASLLMALIAFIQSGASSAGIPLIAAGVAFGSLAAAVLRR